MWDPMVFDQHTFEFSPMKMPADKLDLHRKRSHNNYMRDLKRAYEWEARQKAIEEPDESKEDEIKDRMVIDPVTFEVRYMSGRPIDSNQAILGS